ncbi:MAG: hypothetical protein OEY61_11320 [Gammaproteobacteria bacterium]|nr:hypothetical protein [Gammaproteobacteria bacterium]
MSLELIKALQNDITRFLIIIVLSAIFAGGSYYYFQSISEERSLSESNLLKIKKKYAAAIESKKTVEEFKKRYEKLKVLEITETENRLNWIDLIESTARNKGIPYVKYKISKQEPSSDLALTSKYKGIDVFQSQMQLEMNILHEGDVYELMQALDKQALGIFDISSCNIKRKKIDNLSVVESGTDRNFSAVCVLNWYTMKPKGV